MLWDDKAKQVVQSASGPSTGIAPIMMSYGMMAARLPLSAGVSGLDHVWSSKTTYESCEAEPEDKGTACKVPRLHCI